MSAEYPVGTVARVRVGEWEGRAARDFRRNLGGIPVQATPAWLLTGHPSRRIPLDSEVTVLAVELPAPVTEPKAFGARVEFGPEGERREAVLADPGSNYPWVIREKEDPSKSGWVSWRYFTNPVVLHDPEADR